MKMINNKMVFVLFAVASLVAANAVSEVSREKVTFAQQVDPDKEQKLADVAVSQSSRAFFRTVDGDELNNGVEFMLDAENAVIQLSPLDSVKNGKRLLQTQVPQDMTLSNGRQERNVNETAIDLHRTSQQLRENFPEMYGRAHAMRVPETMGRGQFRLKTNTRGNKDQKYVLYVLDKNSDIKLHARAAKSRFARGDRLELDVSVESASKAGFESVESTLVAPGGKRFRVPGNIVNGRYQTDWPVEADAPGVPGELWQVEIRSSIRNARNELVERVAILATNIFEKTANVISVDSGDDEVSILLNVEASGRYEIRALVYGVDLDGEIRPALLTYQAEWLEPGKRAMDIPLERAELLSSGLNAPYEVRNVQLLDQGRMAVLENHSGGWEVR